MIVSDEEKRWIVVGIALNKVAAPVLRDAVTKGMDNNYGDLDRHCKHSTPPCTLGSLNYGNVRADPAIFRNLKFQNINNNNLVHGLCNYNYKINSAIDLAKLYLPGYLAQFAAFDESLDMTAILRLLGFEMYMPAAVFSLRTKASADDVRENVRNKWGRVDLTEWTDALFNDCFAKLETLLKSLGLTTAVEKKALEQLADWKSKGCQLIVENSVVKDILHLVQDEVRDLIKDYKTMESQLNLQNKQVSKVLNDVSILQEYSENRGKEIKNVLKELQSLEAQLFIRLQEVEQGLADTNDRVEQLEQNQDLLHERCDKADDKVEQIEDELTKLKEGTSKPDANEDYETIIINNTGNVAVGSSSKIVIIGNNVNSAQPPCSGGKGLRDGENMSGSRFSSQGEGENRLWQLRTAANTTQNCTTRPPPPPLPRKKKMLQGDEKDLHQKQMQYNQQPEGRNILVNDDSSDEKSDSEKTDAANTTQNCTTPPPRRPPPLPPKKKMLQGDEEDLHQKQMQYNQQPEGRNILVSDDSSDEKSDSEITDAANTTQNCTTRPPPTPLPRKKKMLQGDEKDLRQKQMQYNQQPEGRNILVSDDSSDERSDSEITDVTGKKAKVTFSRHPADDYELSLNYGDIVDIQSDMGDDWWWGQLAGKEGMIPSTFAELIDEEDIVQANDMPKERTRSNQVAGKKAKVTFSRHAEDHTELSINYGDIVDIKKKVGKGWWWGRLAGKEGMFPSNFVELIDDEDVVQAGYTPEVRRHTNPDDPEENDGYTPLPPVVIKNYGGNVAFGYEHPNITIKGDNINSTQRPVSGGERGEVSENSVSKQAANDTQNCTTQPPVSKENLLQGDEEHSHVSQMEFNQQAEEREHVWRPRPEKGVLVNDDAKDVVMKHEH